VHPTFRDLAAFHHLDLIPSLSTPLLRSSDSLSACLPLFHRHYDAPAAPASSLSSLYAECVLLLRLFGFAPADVYSSPDGSSYFFGALRGAFAAFHGRCFPAVPAAGGCVTPGAVRQLRALAAFASAALARLGFANAGDACGAAAAVRRFQAARGMTPGCCDAATLHAVWTALLAPADGAVAVLTDAGVAVDAPGAAGDEKFGEIDAAGCDECGRLIAVGLTRSVGNLHAPDAALDAARRQLLEAAAASARQVREVAGEAERVSGRVDAVVAVARELAGGARGSRERAARALAVVEGVADANREVAERLANVKERMAGAARRTRVLVIAMCALFAVLLIEWLWKRRRAR
jgi:hypothetical protein